MTWRVLQGDAIERLRELGSGSVQTCVTSPPYWGLRDYGTGEWAGGELGCDHVKAEIKLTYGQECGRCGARRTDSQLGLEPTPDEYVANLVAVFREVRRALRDDGTVWLNLGDSYASQPAGNSDETFAAKQASNAGSTIRRTRSTITSGLKPKDLCGIPWRVAFALQADGWWLRSDIIWSKPNPMPESVTDRPTRAHEYVFLLSKSARYFYDADAIREAHVALDPPSPSYRPSLEAQDGRLAFDGKHEGRGFRAFGEGGRNKRSVWEIATQPYSEAHFATFPIKLVEPCILAGSVEGDTVLDPFAGSGTTGVVALRHNRSFVGIELNADYVEMARRRIVDDCPLHNSPLEIAA